MAGGAAEMVVGNRSRLFDISGKTALVTGGSRGVGLMIARGFVEAGANVYIAARSADVCEAAAAELSALPGGGKCVALPADLSSEDGCVGLAEAVKEREDRLDILVNNAGMQGVTSRRKLTQPVWEEVVGLNVEAVFHLTWNLLPLLKAASQPDDPARVLNVGSIAGKLVSDIAGYAYSTTKAAVHHLTKHMARRLAPAVTVNGLLPGTFESKMTEGILALFGNALVGGVPLKRIGRPDDLTGTAIFLTSPAGAWVTGVIVPLDGGVLVRWPQ